MYRRKVIVLASLLACLVIALAGCAGNSQTGGSSSSEPATSSPTASAADTANASTSDSASSVEQSSAASGAAVAGDIADGDYTTDTKTDSSMFHPVACTLHVQDGAYTATITMPGEGFSRLYFGTSEEAATAPDSEIYDYYLGDDGKYTFDVPVSALDEELTIAAWGQRRDRWYDHSIIFYSPGSEQASAA